MAFTIYKGCETHTAYAEWIRDIQAANVSKKFVVTKPEDFLAAIGDKTPYTIFFFPQSVEDIKALGDETNVFALSPIKVQEFIKDFENDPNNITME